MNKHYITNQNKKYFYTLEPKTKKTTFIKCADANINQEFLNEDVPNLLRDLPNLILAEKKYNKKQADFIRFRVSQQDKKMIEKNALQKGYPSVASFLRDMALNKT